MNVLANYVMAAIAMGACCASMSGSALAENDAASKQAALRDACVQQDGRFEISWLYNDQGVKWGKVMSCSTKANMITCQGNVCKSAANGSVSGSFPAEPSAFSNALAALSGK